MLEKYIPGAGENLPVKSALDILGQMPPVEGNELTLLLDTFQGSLGSVVEDPQKLQGLYDSLQEINPSFSVETYSENPKADVLANVVAGYYAPLIHGFSSMVLKNIQAGILPNTVVAPPRDAIPIAMSIRAMSQLKGMEVSVLEPPITRKVAGVFNNQNGLTEGQDLLFGQMVEQTFHQVGGVTEVEFGIYSTTSLVTALELSRNGVDQYVPLKFYGLGPNLSWVHALLSDGQEWVADEAELNGQVNSAEIAHLMVLIDSLEEFGMQNMHQSVTSLSINDQDLVVPIIELVDQGTLEIAMATNQAVTRTTEKYMDIEPEKVVGLLKAVPTLVELANQGFPVILASAIPPMDNYDDHFQQIKDSGIFTYPSLLI